MNATSSLTCASLDLHPFEPSSKLIAQLGSLGIDPGAEFRSLRIDPQTDRVVGLLVRVGQDIDPLVHVASQVPDAA